MVSETQRQDGWYAVRWSLTDWRVAQFKRIGGWIGFRDQPIEVGPRLLLPNELSSPPGEQPATEPREALLAEVLKALKDLLKLPATIDERAARELRALAVIAKAEAPQTTQAQPETPAGSNAGEQWRVGGKVPLNVYEGDRPMFQCHTPEDAARIVELLRRGAGEPREREKPPVTGLRLRAIATRMVDEWDAQDVYKFADWLERNER